MAEPSPIVILLIAPVKSAPRSQLRELLLALKQAIEAQQRCATTPANPHQQELPL